MRVGHFVWVFATHENQAVAIYLHDLWLLAEQITGVAGTAEIPVIAVMHFVVSGYKVHNGGTLPNPTVQQTGYRRCSPLALPRRC